MARARAGDLAGARVHAGGIVQSGHRVDQSHDSRVQEQKAGSWMMRLDRDLPAEPINLEPERGA